MHVSLVVVMSTIRAISRGGLGIDCQSLSVALDDGEARRFKLAPQRAIRVQQYRCYQKKLLIFTINTMKPFRIRAFFSTSSSLRTSSRPVQHVSRASLSPQALYHTNSSRRLVGFGYPPPLTVSFRPVHRSFHPSRPRHDVFFVAFPALKSALLNVTRFTLLFLPFVFRYKLVNPPQLNSLQVAPNDAHFLLMPVELEYYGLRSGYGESTNGPPTSSFRYRSLPSV